MRPRVLMLTHRLPYPPDRGDRIRSWQVLQHLARHADVHLAAVHDHEPSDDQIEHLAQHTSSLSLQRIDRLGANARALVALTIGRPATPAAFYHRRLSRRVTDAHTRQPFDAIYTFCTGMLPYAADVLATCDATHRPRHVLDLVDIDSAKWAAYAEQRRGPRRLVYTAEARRLRPLEAGLTCPVDELVVVAHREAELHAAEVAQPASPPVHVIPNGVQEQTTPTLRSAATKRLVSGQANLLFIGVLDYPPNIDAVRRFARDILPRIRRETPDTRFTIVGRSPVAEVRQLSNLPGVDVVGTVNDLLPYYAAADVVVVPLTIARGLQNKVLEALAHGKPTVCSPQAAAGLDPSSPLVIADTDNTFAAACIRLLNDPHRREELARAGLDHVRAHYHWDTRLAPLLNLLLPGHADHEIPRLAA